MFGKKSDRNSPRRPLHINHHNQPVFSYRAARKESDRQFDRGMSRPGKETIRLRRKLRHVPFILSLIAVGAALVYNLTLVPDAQIIVSGNQTVLRPRESYQEAINNQLRSSLSNRTKATINTKRLSDTIRAQFPEIETITISLPLLRHQPVVEVRLGSPAALLATPMITYVLDSNGRTLFDKSDAIPDFDASKLPVISDPSGHQITIGTSSLTSQQVMYANELIAQAGLRQLTTPESMTLQAGGEELHVRFPNQTYIVKFSFATEARQSFGTFLATKDRLERDRVGVAEYIDVRIPERAYVK